jgi:transcriptional regulator with GAF, ATPase, and Fis domain/CheY-like chemotaxis protein
MSAQATPVPSIAPRTLVASDNAAFRHQFLSADRSEGSVEEAFSGAHALSKLGSLSFDTLILDRHLPDLNVQEVADLVRLRFPHVKVTISAPPEEKIALPAPAEPPASFPASVRPYDASDSLGLEKEPLPGMVGKGRAMQHIYQLSRLVAARDTTVLITGETGTGKELVARGIHEISRRAANPFVVVNCAAIPEALLEAELFGHARGAFTGAVQSRVGRIHNAHGGTLFLDEIGDLPLTMQAKLLRFLQDGEVQRLGSSDVFRVDVRVLCATNVNLLNHVKQKLFRQDLYYRVAVFPMELPPLRERPEDIGPLAQKFLADLCQEAGVPAKRLSASSIAFLRQSQWPGNVRELQHSVERAFILAGQEMQLHVEHFSHTTDPSHFKQI